MSQGRRMRSWVACACVCSMLGCRAPDRLVPQYPTAAKPTLISAQLLAQLSQLPIEQNTAPSADKLKPADHSGMSSQGLDLSTVVTRAKEFSTTPRLLEAEQALFVGMTPCTDTELEQMLHELLDCIIRGKRNASAQEAATAYCRLVHATLQLKLIDEISHDLSELESHIRSTQAAGGKTTLSLEDLADRKLVLDTQALMARQNLQSQQTRLGELLGLSGDLISLAPAGYGWLDAHAIKDAESAVALAFEKRSDLSATEFLLPRVKRKTLPVVRAYLKQFDGALGQTPLPGQLTGHSRWHYVVDTAPGEIKVRREQLERLAESQRHGVQLQANHSVELQAAALEQLRLAIQRQAQAQARQAELTAHVGTPGVTEVGVRLAEITVQERILDVYKAELDLHLAQVQLLGITEAF